ncbi:hypothetical protein [Parvicella tangerina]|nr:hypothetical protein [Parvicella tangerina]
MKEPIKYLSIVWLLTLFSGLNLAFSQVDHEDYINSSTDKKEFSNKQWKKLKGKLKSESSGSNSSGEGFDGSDFSTGEGAEGDYYDYYEEEYKGEFSEYQNYEDYENSDYDHSEYDDYESYSNEDYYYEDKDDSEQFDYYEKPQEKSSQPKSRPKSSSSSSGVSSGALSFMQILLIIIGVAILAFLIYYLFMRYQEENDGAKVATNFDEVAPSEIPKTELERRLEEALGKGDYREAVRIYFIFIIKDLSDKNWIQWEKRKTNISYLIEMRNRPQYDLFNKSVSVFEVVWYGNYNIDQQSFQEVEPTFKQLLAAIHR